MFSGFPVGYAVVSYCINSYAAGGVYNVSVPRAERVTEHGAEVPAAMGLPTVINFQAAGNGKAATTGDSKLTLRPPVTIEVGLPVFCGPRP